MQYQKGTALMLAGGRAVLSKTGCLCQGTVLSVHDHDINLVSPCQMT